jgi:hypothetical protein
MSEKRKFRVGQYVVIRSNGYCFKIGLIDDNGAGKWRYSDGEGRVPNNIYIWHLQSSLRPLTKKESGR